MELIKIGAYIASKRKELNITQKQLAEKLGMSDKSVSKWERGICLPDVSIYADLCQILGISINEFILGEDIDNESIAAKSEESILRVSKASKVNQGKLKKIIALLLIVSLISVGMVLSLALGVFENKNYIEPVAKESC